MGQFQTNNKPQDGEFLTKCSSTFYDALTIFISMADITTDIMVLISYYYAERMTFFWISLTILIAAQFGYVIFFWIKFDFIYDFKCFVEIGDYLDSKMGDSMCFWILMLPLVGMTFLLMLPLGHLLPFVMFFAKDQSKFAKWMKQALDLEMNHNRSRRNDMSKVAKFTADKLNKHGGFILEAFLEALPQSILQLIAMVYYQETSWIAVGSILLSMTSIMSKSLVISKGVDLKSYIWCWLCVCTDFFSIFFIVSWIFLSNEHIDGDFFGIFNIFGEIWCLKVMIAIVPFFVFGFVVYILFGFWMLVAEIWVQSDPLPFIARILIVFGYIVCGNVLILLGGVAVSFIGILLMEILCFSIPAIILWMWCDQWRWAHHQKNDAAALGVILHFIHSASWGNKDRVLRILAVNDAYDDSHESQSWVCQSRKSGMHVLKDYIKKRETEGTLHQVTYSDIRNNAKDQRESHLFLTMRLDYLDIWKELTSISWNDCTQWAESRRYRKIFTEFFYAIMGTIFMWLILPMWMLTRIVSVFYPYFIVGYLSINGLWNEMALFELVMLWTYIGLQVLILLLGISVFRTHHALWHVLPGVNAWQQKWLSDPAPYQDRMHTIYYRMRWAPVVREMIMQQFGSDIGLIVMDYVAAIDLEQSA